MVTSTSRNDMKEAIIIGVDFGTTFSAVAWCYTGSPKIIRMVKPWPADNYSMEKVPSVIQYSSKNSSRYKWGFEVDLEAPNSIQFFKLLLNEQSAGTAVSGRAPPMPQHLSETHRGDADQLARLLKTIASLPADKTPLAVVTDYLKGIYKHTRDVLETAYPTSFTSSIGEDIALEFCLTVPAIWNDTAKDLTLQAARAAGMSESHVEIKTVSEPEAAAIHCLKTFHEAEYCLKVGDVYVIADCGRGTVDLISYEIKTIEPWLQVNECVAGTSGRCGSTTLNRRFEALVKERLGTTEWENMSTVDRFNTMRHFDTFLKFKFCPSETPDEEDDEFDLEYFLCPVPGVPNNPGKGIRRGILALTTEEMTGIFEPTFVEITSLVQQQITTAETKIGAPITGVLLLGDFGSSPYLFKYLSTKLKRSDGIPVKVLQPPDACIATALGAVQYGLSMRQVREGILPSGSGTTGYRIARFSYGVCTDEPFIPGLHPSNKMYYSALTGGFWCRGRVQWFVKRNKRILDGDDIEVELVKNCSTRVKPDQLVFSHEILCCDLEEPPKDAESTDLRLFLTFTTDLSGVSREKLFIRRQAAHNQSAYFAIPLSMLMRYESGCLSFSMAVGGKAVGKGSVNFDHETPHSVSRLVGCGM